MAASVPSLPLSSRVWVSSCVSQEDPVLGGRAPLIQEDPLSDPSLPHTCKNLLLNEVMF